MHPAYTVFHNRQIIKAKRTKQLADTAFIDRPNLVAQGH